MNIQELGTRSTEAAGLLKALANPARLRILCELHHGERSVSALEAAAGLRQSALSQHLAKLRQSGIVATRREAQTIYYRVSDPRALQLLKLMYELFCAQDDNRKAKRKAK